MTLCYSVWYRRLKKLEQTMEEMDLPEVEVGNAECTDIVEFATQ